MIPDQPAFTLDEVAGLTGFTKATLADACRRGMIRHQHFGRQRTMTREQVIEFIAATEVRPLVEPVVDLDAVRIEAHRRRVARRLGLGS